MTQQDEIIKNNTWKVVAVSEHDNDGLTFWTIQGGMDQIERTFWVKHPPLATAEHPRPVLLVFHGYGGSSSSSGGSRRILEQWESLAQDLNLWLIAPNGAFKGWNAVDCCGDAIAYNIHETDFIEAILHFLQQQQQQEYYYNVVDAQTVVATGHSNGGFLTSLLGQQHPDWLKAILPVAGYQYQNYDENLMKPMPIFMHHGQNDTQVPVEGWCHNGNAEHQRRQRPHHAYDGDGTRWLVATKHDDGSPPPDTDHQCMSLQRVFEIWLQTNSCKSTAVRHQDDDLKICQVGVSCRVPTELCIWKNSRHSGNYTNLIPNASRDFLSAVLLEEDNAAATFVVAPGKVISLVLVVSSLALLIVLLFRNQNNSQRRYRERQVTDATELVPIARGSA